MDVMVVKDEYWGPEKSFSSWYLVPRFLALLLLSNIFIRGTCDLWLVATKRYHAGRQWLNDFVFELRLCMPFRGWNKSIEGCARSLHSWMTEDSAGSAQLHVSTESTRRSSECHTHSASPKSVTAASVSRSMRTRSMSAPSVPTRHQHLVRGSVVYTTWYESTGPFIIQLPHFVPPHPAYPGEIYIHYVLGGEKQMQVWLWTQYGTWEDAPATGTVHPIMKDRHLVMTPSGRPSWVKASTIAQYRSRERRL